MSFVIISYFLINRTYSFISFFYLLLIYVPILTILFIIITLIIWKKTLLKKRAFPKWKKIIIISTLLLSFYSPFLFGAAIPHDDPKVNVSPNPMQLQYDKGGQVQEVRKINILIKSVEGNAKNIVININVPNSFFYWVDGIINDTKTINHLDYDKIVSFVLDIQPSASVGNGTYTVTIEWSYTGDLGNTFHNSIDIFVLIGEVRMFPMYHLLIVIGITSGVVIVLGTSLLLKRKKKIAEFKNDIDPID